MSAPDVSPAAGKGARIVRVERNLPHAPEKVWRALTQPRLIEEWLAKTDFQAVKGHRFEVRLTPPGSRNFCFACEVTAVDPHRLLAYTWVSLGSLAGEPLRSHVIWHLTPVGAGTHLRMEQTGFDAEAPDFFIGARLGWPRIIDALDQSLARLDEVS